ncbi:MAG: hypothetical protein WA383_03215 [Terriglobales bacterium]
MMRRAMYGAVAFMALALVLFGTYHHVSAQGESNRGNPPASAPISHKALISHKAPISEIGGDPPTVAINEVLVQTYFVHGTQNGTSFPSGPYTAVDSPLTVQCLSTTCTIVADMWVQTGGASTPSNNYATCLYVDDVAVDTSDGSNGCHFTEDTPSDGTFIEAGEEDLLSGVGPGAHTVQTFLYSTNGTPVFNYNISYRVYEP